MGKQKASVISPGQAVQAVRVFVRPQPKDYLQKWVSKVRALGEDWTHPNKQGDPNNAYKILFDLIMAVQKYLRVRIFLKILTNYKSQRQDKHRLSKCDTFPFFVCGRHRKSQNLGGCAPKPPTAFLTHGSHLHGAFFSVFHKWSSVVACMSEVGCFDIHIDIQTPVWKSFVTSLQELGWHTFWLPLLVFLVTHRLGKQGKKSEHKTTNDQSD